MSEVTDLKTYRDSKLIGQYTDVFINVLNIYKDVCTDLSTHNIDGITDATRILDEIICKIVANRDLIAEVGKLSKTVYRTEIGFERIVMVDANLTEVIDIHCFMGKYSKECNRFVLHHSVVTTDTKEPHKFVELEMIEDQLNTNTYLVNVVKKFSNSITWLTIEDKNE